MGGSGERGGLGLAAKGARGAGAGGVFCRRQEGVRGKWEWGLVLVGMGLVLGEGMGAPPVARREPAPILAPFGMRWGISPEDFELMIKNFKVQTKVYREGQQIRAVEVRGIPQRNLLAATFHFEEGMLWEIELELGDERWGGQEYNDFFLMTKRVLERRYGVGQAVPTLSERVGEVETTLGGYVWRQFGGSIQLYFFQARRGGDVFYRISQHFRPK